MITDNNSAIEQIRRDKHTLLEGYVTEYLFKDQFLKDRNDTFSKGWWSASLGKERYFFYVKEFQNIVDRRLETILSSQYEVWKVSFGDDLYFSSLKKTLSLEEFIDSKKLRKKRTPLNATCQTKNENRQNNCIDFFLEKDILLEVAKERYFADDFLTEYFDSMVNIDFVTINKNDELCVIETKFKYESRADTFGINSGQLQLFRELDQLGLQIFNVVLYNTTKDKSLSIFGYLNRTDINKYWLYGKLTNLDKRTKSMGPEETSVDGKKKQECFSFDKKELNYRCELRVR